MKLFFCLCAVGLVMPASALAAGITYDCDTAANHFSELVLPAVGVRFTVSGTIQMNAMAGSAKYAPIGRIQVASSSSPGHSPDVYAGFSLSALPVDAKKNPSGASAIQMLSYNSRGKEDEVLPLSMLTKPGTVQPFTLSYDGQAVSVNLGTEVRSFRMKTADPVVRIVCSTGEFLVTNLTIQPTG
jgi:hypothetical protein